MPHDADHVTSPAPKGKRPGKIGPAATYTDADLAIYAAHEPHRADVRPAACNYGEQCWVRFGPPCMTNRGHMECIGCGGRPW